jgi:hypothetical protein
VEPFGPTPKVGSRSPPRDVGASIGLTASLEKKRRLVRTDGSSVSEPESVEQQAPSKAAMEHVHDSYGGGPGAEQVGAKKATAPMSEPKVVAMRTVMVTRSSDSAGDGSKSAQIDIEKAPKTMPDLKTMAKRVMLVTTMGGSNPPCKWFCAT